VENGVIVTLPSQIPKMVVV